MNHDVFICYDENDKQTALEVCHLLEENRIKCWIKSRDYTSKDSVEKISQAIRDSRCMVLIYSKDSKNSKPVITETDIAFSSGISILVFNIDESKNNGGLEFFLKNKPWISAFPNPSEQLKTLVESTSDKIGKKTDAAKVPSKTTRYFKAIRPQENQKLKMFIKIGIPAIIILILIFSFVIYPMGRNTTDSGEFSMKITDVDVKQANGQYFYTVYGESCNLPENSQEYIMKTSYFDENNNQVYSVNASADEF